jgi:hypothetical protein
MERRRKINRLLGACSSAQVDRWDAMSAATETAVMIEHTKIGIIAHFAWEAVSRGENMLSAKYRKIADEAYEDDARFDLYAACEAVGAAMLADATEPGAPMSEADTESVSYALAQMERCYTFLPSHGSIGEEGKDNYAWGMRRLKEILAKRRQPPAQGDAPPERGLVSLDAVEKAIRDQGNTSGGWNAFIAGVRARLAPPAKKTAEERVTIRGRSPRSRVSEYWEVLLDGAPVYRFDQRECAEIYRAGLIAKLEKEAGKDEGQWDRSQFRKAG